MAPHQNKEHHFTCSFLSDGIPFKVDRNQDHEYKRLIILFFFCTTRPVLSANCPFFYVIEHTPCRRQLFWKKTDSSASFDKVFSLKRIQDNEHHFTTMEMNNKFNEPLSQPRDPLDTTSGSYVCFHSYCQPRSVTTFVFCRKSTRISSPRPVFWAAFWP